MAKLTQLQFRILDMENREQVLIAKTTQGGCFLRITHPSGNSMDITIQPDLVPTVAEWFQRLVE